MEIRTIDTVHYLNLNVTKRVLVIGANSVVELGQTACMQVSSYHSPFPVISLPRVDSHLYFKNIQMNPLIMCTLFCVLK